MILNKTNLNSYREFPNEVQNENEILTDKTVEELFYNGDINYPLFTIESDELVFNVSAEDIKAEIQAKEQEKLKAEISNAIQSMLDTKAQSLRYDNINSIAKYLGYDNAFKSECERLGAWAASCWVKAGSLETEVKLGLREQPTKEEVLAEMPSYN